MLSISTATPQVIDRARNDALTMAAVRSALATELAVLSALAGKPQRRKRGIRVIYDDGIAIGTEDIDDAPAPAAEGVEAPAAPGGAFANVFGSVEGLGGR
jgi:hypothetical protein